MVNESVSAPVPQYQVSVPGVRPRPALVDLSHVGPTEGVCADLWPSGAVTARVDPAIVILMNGAFRSRMQRLVRVLPFQGEQHPFSRRQTGLMRSHVSSR